MMADLLARAGDASHELEGSGYACLGRAVIRQALTDAARLGADAEPARAFLRGEHDDSLSLWCLLSGLSRARLTRYARRTWPALVPIRRVS